MTYSHSDLAIEPAETERAAFGMGEAERTTFGVNLKAARREKGMTQEQLASMADIKQGYLSRIEAGRVAMTIDVMVRLARAVGAEVRDLLKP